MKQSRVSQRRSIEIGLISTLCALSVACSGAAGQPGASAADGPAADGGESGSDASAATADASAATANASAATADASAATANASDPVPAPTPEADGGAVTAEAAPAVPALPRAEGFPATARASAPPADDGPSEPALRNPAPGSAFFVGANFWNIGWQGSADYFARGTDFSTTSDPWRADFIRELAPYHVLRFMDWNLTNDSDNPQATWASRVMKSDDQRGSVALEWQLDLCNRAKTDCWITVPHESDPAYWTQLAELVRDTLDPSLRIYVEWSNELWNTQFPQRAYAQNRGAALGLAGDDPAAAFYVHQAVRVFEAFEAVFGKDSPRLVKVLAGQATWSGPCEAHRAALADPAINPKRTRASAYAIAPYPKGDSIPALRASLGAVKRWVEDNAACASKADLPLISYEGGTDSFGSDNGQACRALQRDPGMRALYTDFLNAMYGAKLLGPFMQYTHSGACWGLKPSTDADLASSPKYQAILDWTRAHP